ncbi:hypothetical protein B0A50_07390 [Salinomyces thailandicus]|uniref:Cell wall protein n=1 Tax=Salinomyces thailandicus TaxID=706561 RepID=A0A4U0TM90_9PEZI|nr:hypothetical protein B0A50_07390 [Salinomyces thailandica]
MPSITISILLPATLATLALARTDLVGCTSTDVSSPAGASYAWYVPGTGELCDPLDCGGGRAPPKYDVPGCAAYTGTETYSPSYLPGYGSATAAAVTGLPSASASASASSSSSFNWDSLISEAETATSSWDLYTTWSTRSSSSTTPIGDTVPTPLMSTSTYTLSASTTPTMQTTTAAPYYGTVASGSAGGSMARNGTSPSATGSPIQTVSAVNGAGSKRFCMGGAGVIVAFGAFVAAL